MKTGAKQSLFSLLLLAMLSACSTEMAVAPRSLEEAIPVSAAFPDGRTVEVSPQGHFLLSEKDHSGDSIEIDNPELWSFRTPAGSIVFRRVYLFARITRHGDRLAMQLITNDGVLARCEVPIRDTRHAGRRVTRYERHAVDRGDHPSIDETTEDDFFLSPAGDLIIRRRTKNVAWYPLRHAYESGFVLVFKAR